VRLIGDKMSLRSIENIGCKYLMGVTDLGRGSVSQSNNSGYSPSGGRKRHIHLPKMTTRLVKTIEEEDT
jgi:hypothetical protein